MPDVNILIAAYRQDHPFHAPVNRWFMDALSARQPFGISELVVSSFLRIVTNPKGYPDASPVSDALRFIEPILDISTCVSVRSGPRHLEIFFDLCRQPGIYGNLIPDAYLAALAIE